MSPAHNKRGNPRLGEGTTCYSFSEVSRVNREELEAQSRERKSSLHPATQSSPQKRLCQSGASLESLWFHQTVPTRVFSPVRQNVRGTGRCCDLWPLMLRAGLQKYLWKTEVNDQNNDLCCKPNTFIASPCVFTAVLAFAKNRFYLCCYSCELI